MKINSLLRGAFLAATSLVMLAASCEGNESPPPKSRRETIPVDYLPLAKNVGIVILGVPGEGGGEETKDVCTGLAISNQLVLTARHCFYEATGGSITRTGIYFDLGRTAALSGKQYSIDPSFVEENEAADFVVFKSSVLMDEFSITSLQMAKTDVPPGESLFLLHHPGPGSLVLTQMECAASNPPLDGIFMHHTCDTDPGSSGAPIFDKQFHFVGIHRSGSSDQDPKQFRVGITLKAIIERSSAVASSLAKWSGSGDLTSMFPLQAEYKTSFNAIIRKRSDAWSYRTSVSNVVDDLADISDEPGYLTLWRGSADQFFRFPMGGGELDLKPSAVANWQKFGSIAKTK